MATSRKGSLVTPAALAASTANDPQFRVPALPNLNPAVPFAFVDDKLVVEATQSRRVLSGPAITQAVAPAAALIDGTRSWSQLADETGLTEEQVIEMLSMLYMTGVLDDGPQPFEDTPANRYLARTADATRVNANVLAAVRRRDSVRVGISASIPSARMIVESLSEQSLASRLVSSFDDVNGLDLLIVDPTSYAGSSLADHAHRLRTRGVPVLPVRIIDQTFMMGPVAWPDFGACMACSTTESLPVSNSGSDSTAAMMVAMLSLETVNLLGRVGRSATNASRLIVDLGSFTSRSEVVSPKVSCAVCGGGAAGVAQFPAYEYEESVAFPPQHLNDPRRHQAHYEDASARLTLEFRKFGPRSAAIKLPDLPGSLGELNVRGLSLETLAEILGGAFGVQAHQMAPDAKLPRWAPTGGNLGSPQAYIHIAGVDTVPDGLYAYYPPEHSLYRLGSSHARDDVKGVQLVLTGELTRVAAKYKTFAYRVVCLDAGVATLHVAILGKIYDVDVRLLPHWDEDELDRKYGLNYRDQAVTAVIELGRNV